jgi:hypothetical protein
MIHINSSRWGWVLFHVVIQHAAYFSIFSFTIPLNKLTSIYSAESKCGPIWSNSLSSNLWSKSVIPHFCSYVEIKTHARNDTKLHTRWKHSWRAGYITTVLIDSHLILAMGKKPNESRKRMQCGLISNYNGQIVP